MGWDQEGQIFQVLEMSADNACIVASDCCLSLLFFHTNMSTTPHGAPGPATPFTASHNNPYYYYLKIWTLCTQILGGKALFLFISYISPILPCFYGAQHTLYKDRSQWEIKTWMNLFHGPNVIYKCIRWNEKFSNIFSRKLQGAHRVIEYQSCFYMCGN